MMGGKGGGREEKEKGIVKGEEKGDVRPVGGGEREWEEGEERREEGSKGEDRRERREGRGKV